MKCNNQVTALAKAGTTDKQICLPVSTVFIAFLLGNCALMVTGDSIGEMPGQPTSASSGVGANHDNTPIIAHKTTRRVGPGEVSLRKRARRSSDFSQQNSEMETNQQAHQHRACPTKSSFAALKFAENYKGERVEVAPYIDVGGMLIPQYFQESFCRHDNCPCHGIDPDVHSSSCETDHSLTNARVLVDRVPVWTVIQIRSGCSCVIQRKRSNKSHIIDIIGSSG